LPTVYIIQYTFCIHQGGTYLIPNVFTDSQTRGRNTQVSDRSPYQNRAAGGVGGPGGTGAPLSAHDLALTSTHPGNSQCSYPRIS